MTAFSYDAMGRPVLEARNNNSHRYDVNYTYYKDGSLNTLTYPSGDVLTYNVGGAGRATQLSDASNNYVGYSGNSATYTPSGSLASMTNGHTSAFAGIVTSNIYNDRLQPILLSASVSSSPIFSLCYDFHLHVAIGSPCNIGAYTTGDNGNVFQVLNNVDSTRSAAYIYDPLNRIAQAYTVNTNSANCWGETYSPTATAPGVLPSTPGIDAWGNLTNRSKVSSMGSGCTTEPLSATATTQNQLGGIGMQYDAAGNVINDGIGNTPTYDAENRIAMDAGVTYSYDADGVRMEKSTGSSGTMYWTGPSGEYLTETDLTGTINEEYIYLNGERIARVDRPSGAVHYYFSDNLGTASVITSSSGAVQEQCFYYPYGGQKSCIGTDPNHYKFTGKERDVESGLDYFGARYYTSAVGRFMVPDWAAKPTAVPYASYGNPQSLNLYSYVYNNPMTKADPDGHCMGQKNGTNCQNLVDNPVNGVDAATKAAINNSVKESDHKKGDDKKGGSHEEGGSTWTKDGKETVAPAKPGEYKDVKTKGVAEIDPLKAADPSKQKPDDVKASVAWHVHPKAEVTETKSQPTEPGTVVYGGTVESHTYNFTQTPSLVDIGNAGMADLNIVVGARDTTVYVFDSSGTVCQESLKDFNKEPKK